MEEWEQQFADLLAGPYRGTGGQVALAKALGLTKEALKWWRMGRTSPNWTNRQKLASLWRLKCGKGGE